MTNGDDWIWWAVRQGQWHPMTDWELERQIAELLKATKELGELVERKDARIMELERDLREMADLLRWWEHQGRRPNTREDLG